ncbi:recombinase RecT [Acinetobacter sp. SwsAc6]|uniref:recombinase RecT n=1 Tax=Acinetobacter sp. SwsAc6 TaxID=2749439 RepID=UPI0015C19CBA|nr:recombinase RecT [Acinetobacter sp. SwsAc6]NWK73158.1 recombinase RecT [Acinetobacter sp. SwsAc6]
MTSQVMTTEQLRTQRKPDDVEASFNTYRGFQAMSHMAESLANSTIIPEAFRNTIMVKDRYDQQAKKWLYTPEHNPNGVSNCIIALNMAQRLGADPMMIMQNLYLVDGRPSWSSQFIIAAINSSGRYSPLRFDITGGDEEIEIPYAVTDWIFNKDTRKKEPVESNQTARVKNYKCVAWVIEKATGERLESTPITMEMAVKEGWYQKNGSKWQSMPEQMLRYRAASFFGRIYAPDLLMGLRSQDEEVESMIDVTPEPAPQEEPTTLANIQKNVVKSATANDQNSTSNDVAEKTVSAKKAEPVAEQAPPTVEVQVKKPTSADVKKQYILKMNKAQSAAELNEIHEQFIINDILTEPHLAYLKDAYQQDKQKFTPAEQPAQQEVQVPAVNEIKSKGTANGLKISIESAQTVEALTDIAQTIRDSKPNMTIDHLNDVLNVYQLRKKFLEDQQDMFAGVPDLTWTDSAIKQIESAKNQDDINAVYTDPQFEEQSDKDKQRLNLAAQKRESELFG